MKMAEQVASVSERLRAIAIELSRIAGEPPPEANGPQLAVIASRLMDLSMHVELGERELAVTKEHRGYWMDKSDDLSVK